MRRWLHDAGARGGWRAGHGAVRLWLAACLALLLPLHRATGEEAGGWQRQAADIFHPVATDADLPYALIPEVLAEDAQGFLWLGSESGLLRWDGYTLRIFAPDRGQPDAMRDQAVLCIHRDAAGRLWVGTTTGGLATYDAAHEKFRTVLGDRLAGAARHVWSIDDDGAGGLWLGTAGGLFRMRADASAISRVDLAPAAPGDAVDETVQAVLRDSQGVLWLGTPHGLRRGVAGNARFESIALPATSGESVSVSRLMQDSAGRIWIGSRQHGAYVIEAGRQEARSVVATAASGQVTVATEITALLEVSPGRVWLGTYGSGIFEVTAGDAAHARWLHHRADVPFSLPGDSVQALFRDRSGLVWVGTTEGLSQFAPDQDAVRTVFGDPGRKNGLTAENVMSVLAQPDGSLWVGSQGTGYDVLRADGTLTGNLPGRRVFALVAAPAGGVLAGTDGGLYWSDPQGKPKSRLAIPRDTGVEDVRALKIIDGAIWLGTRDAGLWQLAMAPDGRLSLLWHLDGGRLGGDRVLAIGKAPDGRVAVGLEDGFCLVDPATGAVEQLRTDPADALSLGAGSVVSFANDSAGRLWVGTSESGISVMQGGAAGHPVFRHVGVAEGLPNDDINLMLQDQAGRIWASTDNGIAAVDPADFSVRALRRADGVAIKGYWTGAGDRAADGALIFGGVGGITVLRPERVQGWAYRPPVVVTGVRLGGRPVPFRADSDQAGLVVPPGVNSLAVEFVALDYSAPERNRYRYRLDGFDQGWIDADANHRVATYTNLPPGDFTLRLAGSNRDGIWAARETVFWVRVLPAWYKAMWFRIAAGGSVILLLCVTAFAWSFVVRRRQHELERQVAERTAELTASREQLQHYAYFDTLTGLQNRRAFNEQFRKMLEQAERAPCQFALLLIDLDNFKRVNDVFGHDSGDALLVQAAWRLREAVREDDFLARLGGDEFAVLVPNIRDLDTVEKICGRVVESLCAVAIINGVTVAGGASLGAGVFPDHGATQEDLYRHVDQALYEAKRAGRGTWQWFGSSEKKRVLF